MKRWKESLIILKNLIEIMKTWNCILKVHITSWEKTTEVDSEETEILKKTKNMLENLVIKIFKKLEKHYRQDLERKLSLNGRIWKR